jgi:4-alpha-glucanotransferase
MDAMAEPWLTALADRLGVACAYHDWTGNFVTVDTATVVAVLAALGISADTEESCAASLLELDRRHWARALPPTVVARSGRETAFWVHVGHGEPAHVWVRLEDGTVHSGTRQADNFTPPFDLDGRLIGEATFVLPADLPLGYHRVHLRSGNREFDTPLIVTPAWLGLPPRMGARRAWGLATQLYSVRSEGSWGFGDLTDLTDLCVWAGARHGADYVLINPLHAASPTTPMEPSPYLPTSRRFVNPLYLRVEAIPEFAELANRDRVASRRKRVQSRALKSGTIDRDGVWAAKRKALELVFRGGGSWPSRRSRNARAPRWTISRPGVRWPRSTAATGVSGRRACSTRPARMLPSSPTATGVPWTSTAGCSGNSTINWPTPSPRRCAPA